MQKDYVVVSPSLDGVLSHESLYYEGIRRPSKILRAFDSPARNTTTHKTPHQEKVLQQYFYDLYGVFMKKLSEFVVKPTVEGDETLKLQAILQEMIKIKKLLC